MTGTRGSSWSLPPCRECVGEARELTRKTFADWGMEALTGDALVIVSELMTNAVIHARTAITFALACDGQVVRGEITDRSLASVTMCEADEEMEGGRGLTIVDALADRWGATFLPGRGGKTLWFELVMPEAGSG